MSKPQHIFVTGIGTDVGKTVASAILTEALEADYWKPIQSGDLENSDSHKIQRLISNNRTVIHPEQFTFKTPASPHAAAAIENVTIDMNNIKVPETTNQLLIEGAGGLMVPLNQQDMMVDLIAHCEAQVILVSRNYLGSINHTLLSIKLLEQKKIPVLGIIFNGPKSEATEQVILDYTNIKYLGSIEEHEEIDRQVVLQYKSAFSDITTT